MAKTTLDVVAFLEDYRELCSKHKMIVSGGRSLSGCQPIHLRSISLDSNGCNAELEADIKHFEEEAEKRIGNGTL